MKTTIDLPDSLLEEAKRLANDEGLTLRQLVEEGLRRAVESREQAREFRLRKASYRGKGLQPGVDGSGWERIRELVYEGRGA